MEDKDLLLLFRDPDKRHYAFNLLVRKYQSKVYWHVRKMVIDHDDADDLTQDTFIKVWNNLDKFREDSKIYTWLYRVATNECLTFLQKKRTRFFIPIGDITSELEAKLTAGSLAPTGDDISLRLQKAILQLPDKQRLVFNMRYFDDLSYEEISEILGTTVGALKANYHHAVKKLEVILGASI